jgi:hypothetical protein
MSASALPTKLRNQVLSNFLKPIVHPVEKGKWRIESGRNCLAASTQPIAELVDSGFRDLQLSKNAVYDPER